MNNKFSIKKVISPFLSPTEVKTLFGLMLNENLNSTVKELTNLTGLSRQTVKTCLKNMCAKGLLSKERQSRKNKYSINWSVIPDTKETIQ